MDECRKQFEAWLKDLDPRDFNPGAYDDQLYKWKGWKAAWNRRAMLEAATQPPAIDLDAVISLLSDDALATSFQTLGQYRAHLIGVLKSKAPA